jgi:PTH1 family peptidyl-tRNA hydrolase
MDSLVTFLGNPGSEYAKTRHNIAWMLLETSEVFKNATFTNKFQGLFAIVGVFDQKVGLLMPQTFMNLSGQSTRACMDFYKITPDKMLVVHDELDLEFGKIAFKFGGGDAGHNGLKSITATSSTPNYNRLRMGIGRPTYGSTSDWVLSKFSKEEAPLIESYFNATNKALETYLEKGPKVATNLYNKKSVIGPKGV